MKGTDGGEAGGKRHGDEKQEERGEEGRPAVVLLIVVRCPEVQERTGRPLRALTLLLLLSSSIFVLIYFQIEKHDSLYPYFQPVTPLSLSPLLVLSEWQ